MRRGELAGALPPRLGSTNAISEELSGIVGLSPQPDHVVNAYPGRPRRKQLDSDIAASVRRAKQATGKSWRWLGKRLGISHSHFVQIYEGVRCPSKTVAWAMKPLFLDEGELEGVG
jgi:hypothetical protein